MGNGPGFGELLITLGTGLVMAIGVLFLVWRMIDGDLPFVFGVVAIVLMMVALALAIKPPHPAIPGVVLVVMLTLLAFFPYAEGVLENVELRAVNAGQMARAFEVVRLRPDNYVAKFELARHLHDHGFKSQAIALSSATMAQLGTTRDEVKNQSMQDLFYKEQILLKRWHAEPGSVPVTTCPSCGQVNRAEDFVCAKCGANYPFEIIARNEVRPKVMGKLVLAWGCLAVAFPGIVAAALHFEGTMRIVAFVGGLVLVGVLFAWLFKPPSYAQSHNPY